MTQQLSGSNAKSLIDKPKSASLGHRLTVAAAVLTLILLGQRYQFNHTITLGYVAAFVMAPMWIPTLRRFWGAISLVLGGLVVLGSGFWLSELSKASHTVLANSMVNNSVILVGLLAAFGVVVWSRTLMPTWMVGLAYGFGMLIGANRSGTALENLWKYGFSIPVIVIGLSLGAYFSTRYGRRSRIFEMVPLLLLALYSGLHDSRSLFAMLSLALMLVLWQLIPKGRTPRRSIAKTILAFGVLIVVSYEGGTSLLVDGYLGEEVKARSIAQVDQSGSLLLGGRPEMAASFALFKDHPLGFGLGAVPSLHDIAVAKTGMASINYQPNNGYVERYMFGAQFELHSTTADLWVLFGIPGLLFAVFLLVLLLRWMIVSVVHRNASALVLFLSILTMWNLLFSPILTTVTSMALALGLAVLPKVASRPDARLFPNSRAGSLHD